MLARQASVKSLCSPRGICTESGLQKSHKPVGASTPRGAKSVHSAQETDVHMHSELDRDSVGVGSLAKSVYEVGKAELAASRGWEVRF
jgi:hypothetical protein